MYASTLGYLTVAGGLLAGQETDKPFYVMNHTLVVAKVTETTRFLAYSRTVGEWNEFTFPEGVSTVPVVEGNICAFLLEGEAITELVAIDVKGNWCRSKLPATARKCVPIVQDNVAVYMVDGRAHAFSGQVGTWDSIAASRTPYLGSDTAMIVTPDSIAIFSAATGKWAVAKTTK
jgi:hypothetical protein